MENNYFLTNLKKDCNGCGVCSIVCPKKAIEMKIDDEGFMYPFINKEKCIDCGLCKRSCPNFIREINDLTKTFICKNNDDMILSRSSSGGVFYSIAKYIIEKNGVVFGVRYDKDLNVYHDYVESLDELHFFQGSKYVRSDAYKCFDKVLEFLKAGRFVLFSGTPCQCNSLKSLCKNYSQKLYTCEIICHANPSPLVYDLYKKNLENIYNKKIVNIEFRSKKNGWKNQTPIIYFDDDSYIEDNSYFYAFVREMINRPSCYNCNFCSSNRTSDFTIGDIWGLSKIDDSIVDDDSGLSLLCVNSEKGILLFEDIKESFNVYDVDKEKAFSYNHNSNLKFHKKRNKFFKLLSKNIINENNIIKYFNKYTKLSLIYRIKRLILTKIK